MANAKWTGRMLRSSIAVSRSVAKLSPKSLALFCLLIPHFNAHGKLKGSPYFIKGECCPFIEWLTLDEIVVCMKEITTHTKVHWFDYNGEHYIQCHSWQRHQSLHFESRGADTLPNCPCSEPVRNQCGTSAPRREVEEKGGEEDSDPPESYQSHAGHTLTAEEATACTGGRWSAAHPEQPQVPLLTKPAPYLDIAKESKAALRRLKAKKKRLLSAEGS